MKKILFFCLFSALVGLSAVEVQFNYTSVDVPSAWTSKTDSNGSRAFVSPKGTTMEFSNFGYDMPDYQDVLTFIDGVDQGKIQKKTTKKGLSYNYYEGRDADRKSQAIWAVFSGFRFQGIKEAPTPVGNAIIFWGSSIASDKAAIEAIIQSIKVQPRLDKKLSRYTFPSGGLSFELPTEWIKAPFIGNFTNADQFISPGGAYVHTDEMREVSESSLDTLFKNGYSGYRSSKLDPPETYTNKNGVKVKVYYGSTLIPTNDHDQVEFTVIAVPFRTNEAALFVMVGPIGDPDRLKQILDSIKKE